MEDLEIVALDEDLVEELIDRGATEEQIELLDNMAANGEDISEILNEMFNVQSDNDDDDEGPRISPRRGGIALGGKMMLLEPGFLNEFIESDSGLDPDDDDEEEEEPFDEDAEGILGEDHRGPQYDGYCPLPTYACQMDDGLHVYL